jgi:hypothetical protein
VGLMGGFHLYKSLWEKEVFHLPFKRKEKKKKEKKREENLLPSHEITLKIFRFVTHMIEHMQIYCIVLNILF